MYSLAFCERRFTPGISLDCGLDELSEFIFLRFELRGATQDCRQLGYQGVNLGFHRRDDARDDGVVLCPVGPSTAAI